MTISKNLALEIIAPLMSTKKMRSATRVSHTMELQYLLGRLPVKERSQAYIAQLDGKFNDAEKAYASLLWNVLGADKNRPTGEKLDNVPWF
jgi:hypothetical protein